MTVYLTMKFFSIVKDSWNSSKYLLNHIQVIDGRNDYISKGQKINGVELSVKDKLKLEKTN